jgi:CheY-like chemotaxis protein
MFPSLNALQPGFGRRLSGGIQLDDLPTFCYYTTGWYECQPRARAAGDAPKEEDRLVAYLMMVDDDEAFTDAVALALRHEGYEMIIKSDTGAALEEMQSRAPDLVILDVMFPEDDFAGLELARAMCRRRELSGIPILMLTGLNQKLTMKSGTSDSDAARLPIAEFMDKSMDLDQLVGKVKSFLPPAVRQANSSPDRAAVPRETGQRL